jgi:hypothetical protein
MWRWIVLLVYSRKEEKSFSNVSSKSSMNRRIDAGVGQMVFGVER